MNLSLLSAIDACLEAQRDGKFKTGIADAPFSAQLPRLRTPTQVAEAKAKSNHKSRDRNLG